MRFAFARIEMDIISNKWLG